LKSQLLTPKSLPVETALKKNDEEEKVHQLVKLETQREHPILSLHVLSDPKHLNQLSVAIHDVKSPNKAIKPTTREEPQNSMTLKSAKPS